jgi:hypothetical protein
MQLIRSYDMIMVAYSHSHLRLEVFYSGYTMTAIRKSWCEQISTTEVTCRGDTGNDAVIVH